MAAYYGDKSIDGRAEYERLRLILRDKPSGADEVIKELSRLARKMRGNRRKRRRTLLQSELTFFTNQRHRMDYADYQTRGLPIGSGVVEARVRRWRHRGCNAPECAGEAASKRCSPCVASSKATDGLELGHFCPNTSASRFSRSASTVTFGY